MPFFKVPDKADPRYERRLWSLYLIKHKRKLPEPTFEEPKNPVLPKEGSI